jgi:hypothetical protein
MGNFGKEGKIQFACELTYIQETFRCKQLQKPSDLTMFLTNLVTLLVLTCNVLVENSGLNLGVEIIQNFYVAPVKNFDVAPSLLKCFHYLRLRHRNSGGNHSDGLVSINFILFVVNFVVWMWHCLAAYRFSALLDNC